MERLLERRIRYFLTSKCRGREDVRMALRELQGFGQLALIGGMLRDVTLFGNAGFNSDLDFVIDAYELEAFERCMISKGARINRFGGYALPSKKWQIDVWPLQKTWAHSAGHVKVRTISDLRRATFFSCDAIVYDFAYKRLKTNPGYFDALYDKILEINLLPNPNPTGNAVRALQYSLLKGFRWGPNLSNFMAKVIGDVGWEKLLKTEYHSFKAQHLATLDSQALAVGLDHHLSLHNSNLFDPRQFQLNVQLELPIAR